MRRRKKNEKRIVEQIDEIFLGLVNAYAFKRVGFLPIM